MGRRDNHPVAQSARATIRIDLTAAAEWIRSPEMVPLARLGVERCYGRDSTRSVFAHFRPDTCIGDAGSDSTSIATARKSRTCAALTPSRSSGVAKQVYAGAASVTGIATRSLRA